MSLSELGQGKAGRTVDIPGPQSQTRGGRSRGQDTAPSSEQAHSSVVNDARQP